MKPYTAIVLMKNGDWTVWHGWSSDATEAKICIELEHKKNGWWNDVEKITVHRTRDRKRAGFTLLVKSFSGKREASA